MQTVLITGGAGYIGSHITVELLNSGYQVIIVDNLSNSKQQVISRIQQITGKKPIFYKQDILNKDALNKIFQENKIDAVIHCAGLKSVAESVKEPLKYYKTNIGTTLTLLEIMQKNNVKNLVFSSSATVYGNPKSVPITESQPIGANLSNPYGYTKYMIEQILSDTVNTNNNWQITSLRYFNPIGAHSSGLIGEDPKGIPNNLLPYISQVAVGKLPELMVFGNTYPTKDGTGVRDYIHVVDVAKAHVSALAHPTTGNKYRALNLGTGSGTSVLELINAFVKSNNVKIPFKIVPKRPGDIAQCYANPSKANKELNWHTTRTIGNACKDAYNWQTKNPKGYS